MLDVTMRKRPVPHRSSSISLRSNEEAEPITDVRVVIFERHARAAVGVGGQAEELAALFCFFGGTHLSIFYFPLVSLWVFVIHFSPDFAP